jgi:asparagine synthase (glutamine-hydrolysing)
MCGITGFAGWQRDEQIARAELSAMCGAIRHRGPDEEGQFVAAGVALGMRRLSIIDVAGGSQPIANEDHTIEVVFNGEIYNHHALRAELAPRHVFRSRADTEVLVHLYEEMGERMVERLRGMFAFAIWDAPRRRLFIARDRLGIKPLYYWPTGGGMAFASELRSFVALRTYPHDIDRGALNRYLAFGYVPEPLSIFRGTYKLPPGHHLTWDAESGVRVRQYWTPVRPEVAVADEREAVEELRRLLRDAVGSHLESEVPLGAFLSGGIDSSAVVAEMARQSARPVRTFAIGFDDSAFDESRHASSVARALGTDHTELIVRPDADALVETVVRAFDEPFGDSSALPTLLVSQLARQHVTVALSGDGGDELFAGYTRYAELLGRREVRPRALRSLLRFAALRLPHAAFGRNRLLDLSRTRDGRYAVTVAQALGSAEGGVLGEDALSDAERLEALLEPHFRAADDRDFLTQMTLVDLSTYLPGDILTKVDRASMSVSLEARVPLLDHHLVEFAAGLPARFKFRNGTGKWLFREAITGLVPASVFARPKQGFAVPLRDWFRRDLRYRLDNLMREDSGLFEFIDRASAGRLVREHVRGRRDHSSMLWRLLALDLWMACLRDGVLGRATASSASLVQHAQMARAV